MKRGPLTYRITRYARPGIAGALLSCDGHFGNIPYRDDADAERAAIHHAGREAHEIKRETFR